MNKLIFFFKIQVALSFISFALEAQTFQEISLAVGIEHIYEDIAALGGGVAFFDFDADGDEDIYLSGGSDSDKLYRNDGNNIFTDITFIAGLGHTANYYTTSITTGDIDNDGYREIFVGTWVYNNSAETRSLLYKNNTDGTFTEMAIPAGLVDSVWTMGANFFDVNLDGFLDLYITNYVEDSDVILGENGEAVFNHDCYGNKLFLNNGDLTFTDATELYGIHTDRGCSLASVATDYDLDGDPDICLVNDFGAFIEPNILFQNQFPNNSFTNVSTATGSDIGLYGMGIAIGDYNLDGFFDYYVTNLGRNALLRGNGSGFVDLATAAGVENTNTADSLLTTSWGTAFLDVNNDGWEDLFVANGRIPAAPFIATGELDPNKLFRNNGDGTFMDITNMAGVGDLNRGRGMAYADLDDDGDLDILVNVQSHYLDPDANVTLFRNDNNNNNNWIKFKLTGILCNRDAYGAIVKSFTGSYTYIRELHGGSSHASQHSSIIHFGLGNTEKVDSVHIQWPGGDTQILHDLNVNQTYFITQEVTPLPQHLLSFNGQAREASILLHWKIANEQNTKHYVLQKTLNPSKQYDDVSTVLAKNSPKIQLDYQYQDFDIRKGITYYYRLKMVEEDGSVSYSDIIAIKIQKNNTKPTLVVFPNPAQDIVHISLDHFDKKVSVMLEIFSATGQKIFHQEMAPGVYPEFQVNVSDWPRSVYFVTVGTNCIRPFLKK